MLGRKPTPTPAHLTSVLYIPCHDNDALHLPMYEASDSYHHAVGDTQLGSTLYAVKLSAACKPRGDGAGHSVIYHGNMQRAAASKDGVTISVQKRELSNQGREIRLTLTLPSEGEPYRVSIESPKGSITMDTFFPIPPSTRAGDVIHHPYFTLDIPHTKNDKSSTTSLEWQIHPIEDGPLRYTLVDKGRPGDTTARVRAIYHDAGCSKPLSHGRSEGVLLLPEWGGEVDEEAADMEGIIVASILGVLWQVRALQGGMSVPPKHGKHMGQLRRVLARIRG
ncbi:hypothetical protein PG985_003619 [Apiospora marii]|uniref:Uncharacterized protein n=1 Tax=Apiospora marii TaxID=335849 RepID=A0ABR1SHJ9_9PEZI